MKAENKLIRVATERPRGVRKSSQVRAINTKRGFPGGWGIPRMCPVAMYSLVSQNAVVGERVTVYRKPTHRLATKAQR
jgi:hypothetical protein